MEIVKLVNDTKYQERRPKYLLVLSDPNDWQKIEKGLSIDFPGIFPYTVVFHKVSENVFYTYCGANATPIMHVLQKMLGHDNFFLAETIPYINI